MTNCYDLHRRMLHICKDCSGGDLLLHQCIDFSLWPFMETGSELSNNSLSELHLQSLILSASLLGPLSLRMQQNLHLLLKYCRLLEGTEIPGMLNLLLSVRARYLHEAKDFVLELDRHLLRNSSFRCHVDDVCCTRHPAFLCIISRPYLALMIPRQQNI